MKKSRSSLMFFVFLFCLVSCQFNVFAQLPNSLLYVGNSGDNTISIIDTHTNSIIYKIEGSIYSPEKLFVTPDKKKVYAISSGTFGRRVAGIDTNTHNVISPQIIGGGNDMVFSLTSPVAFLSLFSGDHVKIIFTDNDTVHSNDWELDDPASAMSVKLDGEYVYVDNYYNRDSSIWAYKMVGEGAGSFLKTLLPVANVSYSYHHVRDIGQSPIKDEMYITSGSWVINDDCYVCDQGNYGFLNIYDTYNNNIISTVNVARSDFGEIEISSDGKVACIIDVKYDRLYIFDLTNFTYRQVELDGHPSKLLIAKDNSVVYLLQHELDRVDIIDIVSADISGSILVGDGPYDMLLLSNQPYLYVTNQYSNSVSVIDTRSNSVIDTVAVGNFPKPIVEIPPSNINPNLDQDADGITDDVDNCIAKSNSDQTDSDSDGQGDVCDSCPFDQDNDGDGDGVCGDVDNCASAINPGQEDTDSDGVGDICNDADDTDGDEWSNFYDNCDSISNPDQADLDSDGFGDVCDVCPQNFENDADGDGICETDDNCPVVTNSNQSDGDGDGEGDACDEDNDNDGFIDSEDNCPLIYNDTQADYDGDGAGDACDSDNDGDGVLDDVDECLVTPLADVVNNAGCSITELCPCDGNWKNHGAFVKCVTHLSTEFMKEGLISELEKDMIVSDAAESQCGHK